MADAGRERPGSYGLRKALRRTSAPSLLMGNPINALEMFLRGLNNGQWWEGLNADKLDGYHHDEFVKLRPNTAAGIGYMTKDNIPVGTEIDLQFPAIDGTAPAFTAYPPTASMPVKTDGTAGGVTTGAINLASADGEVTGVLEVVNGGTGAATHTSGGFLRGVGTSAIASTGPGTDQLIGYNGTTPALISAGANITISGGTISASGGGTGDVVGPGSATDNAIARFDGTTGKLIQNSGAAVDDSGNITANNLSGTNTGDQTITLTGDVTGSGTGSFGATIANDAVTYAKMQNAASAGFIGATGAGDYSHRTPTQVTAALDNFVGDSGAGGTKGLVPAPAAGDAAAGKYLDADGTWTVPPASGGTIGGSTGATDNRIIRADGTGGSTIQSSGASVDDSGNITATNLSGTNTGDQTITLTGDVTGSGTGSFAATIANDAVTYAKIQNVSAASKLLGRGDSGSGDVQEITLGTNLSMSGTTLNASGGGSGIDQLTGDVTAGPGSGSQAATIAADAVTNTKLADMAALSVKANATNASADPSDLAAASDHQVLRRSGTALAFGAVNLASSNAVSGQLPVANGGTGASTLTSGSLVVGNGTSAVSFLTAAVGDIIFSDTINQWRKLTIGTDGYYLKVVSGLPSWQPFTGLSNPMTTTGDLIFASDDSGTPARLGIGSQGQALIADTGLPVWQAVVNSFELTPTTSGGTTTGANTGTVNINLDQTEVTTNGIEAGAIGALATAATTAASGDLFAIEVSGDGKKIDFDDLAASVEGTLDDTAIVTDGLNGLTAPSPTLSDSDYFAIYVAGESAWRRVSMAELKSYLGL